MAKNLMFIFANDERIKGNFSVVFVNIVHPANKKSDTILLAYKNIAGLLFIGGYLYFTSFLYRSLILPQCKFAMKLSMNFARAGPSL